MMLFRLASAAYAGVPLPLSAAMTRPRSCLVHPADTRWYHCVSRCVRRAYLCGIDHASGRNFDHRRTWVTERLYELGSLFAIDVAAYAVMSNHYHLVVHLAPERAATWSEREVLQRWTRLFAGPPLVRRYLDGEEPAPGPAELEQISRLAATFRKRLQDLSWFLRLLNESISRRANAEDQCSGRFWEGRFKSQALLDLPGLISAMIYVDLNPVRAGMATTLEASSHTSIHARLRELGGAVQEPGLMPFDATGRAPSAIPFDLGEYIRLADWRARQQQRDQSITETRPPALHRLGLSEEAFLAMSGQLMKTFGNAIGSPAAIAEHCARRELRYSRGLGMGQRATKADQAGRESR